MPEFDVQLSSAQWCLLSKSLTEMMCQGGLTESTIPGVIHYESPKIVIRLDDPQKFENFKRAAFAVVGRTLFTYELVVENESFVHLQTVFY